MTTSDWILAVGSLAQVVVATGAAVVAFIAAKWGIRTSKGSVFLASTISSVMDLVTKARIVRAAYRGMFVKFATADEKQKAMMQWLSKREEVTTVLAELAELVPELAPARIAWAVVEKEEDTFATSDTTLVLPSTAKIDAAHGRYDAEHNKFIKAAGEVLRQLR